MLKKLKPMLEDQKKTLFFQVLHFLNFLFLPLSLLYLELFDDSKFDYYNLKFAYVSIFFLILSLNHRNLTYSSNKNLSLKFSYFINVVFLRIVVCLPLLGVSIMYNISINLLVLAFLISLNDGANAILLKNKLFKYALIVESIKYIGLFAVLQYELIIPPMLILMGATSLVSLLFLVKNIKSPKKLINFNPKIAFSYKYALMLPIFDFIIFNTPRFFVENPDYSATIRIIFYISMFSTPLLIYFQKRLAFNENLNFVNNRKTSIFLTIVFLIILQTGYIWAKIFIGLSIYLLYSLVNYLNYKYERHKPLFKSSLVAIAISTTFFFYPKIDIIFGAMLLRTNYLVFVDGKK